MTDIHAAADIIASARRSNAPLKPLDAGIAPKSESDGYLVQDALHGLLTPDCGVRVGYKIGCTSPVMQQYLGIPHPCYGGVFAKGVHDTGASLASGDFVRVGVECEMAVRLARDLAASQAPFTADTIGDAVEAYLPAIEIVDNRYQEWQSLGLPILVADDFFAAGCVLGKPVARSAAPDLLKVIGRAFISGVEAGQGTGRDVLGHPHNALAWLANHLAARGKQLRRGEIVLTGSLVKTVWLEPGDTVTMELEGLGSVSATFA